MRFVFILFISFLVANTTVAQDKNMSTQDRLKELARVKKNLTNKRRKNGMLIWFVLRRVKLPNNKKSKPILLKNLKLQLLLLKMMN